MPDSTPIVTNEEKKAVWEAYRAHTPTRVPVLFGTNPRIVILNPVLNPEGISFERYFLDPGVTVDMQVRWQRYRVEVLNHYCDDPLGLPDAWQVYVDRQNVYESAFFGAPLEFRPGQVPDVHPYLDDDHKEDIFRTDIEHPLEHGFFRDALDHAEGMRAASANLRIDDRPIHVNNYMPTGCDGPLTVAANIRGQGILADLIADPDYVHRVFDFIIQAAINRVHAVRRHYHDETIGCGLADDSIQLISNKTYRKMVMPHHKRFYDTFFPGKPRGIHLCGDAQHHFKMLHDELDIQSFDTGFPVDFGRLRRELGPEVEILGGPPVAVLLQAAPEQVYACTKDILCSGIMEGGRFILREGNNLPPLVPEANLAAMYQACLDHGRY
ncbi:MAG: uroporphyrinogen decarboxylase family protein [Anaerolineae bacterium]